MYDTVERKIRKIPSIWKTITNLIGAYFELILNICMHSVWVVMHLNLERTGKRTPNESLNWIIFMRTILGTASFVYFSNLFVRPCSKQFQSNNTHPAVIGTMQSYGRMLTFLTINGHRLAQVKPQIKCFKYWPVTMTTMSRVKN